MLGGGEDDDCQSGLAVGLWSYKTMWSTAATVSKSYA